MSDALPVDPDSRRLVLSFRRGEVPPGGLTHRRHVQLAWSYLRRDGLCRTLDRLSRDLRAFAAAQGKPEIYHETLTWAYVMLLHERMERSPECETFDLFCERNPDLLDHGRSPVRRLYVPEVLDSDFARRVFVLPGSGLQPEEAASNS